MENDLIRRSDAVHAIHERIKQIGKDKDPYVLSIRQSVREIPAVDAVEEKQGFWKVAGTGHPKPGNQRFRKQDQWTVYKCSNCGASNGRNRSDPYCRHCGARMLVDNCRYCYNGARMDGRREDGDVDG